MIESRRARAAISIGLLWGVTWATCGVALAAWRVFFGRPHFADPSRYLGRFMLTGGTVLGVCGLVAGAAFALVLSRAERHRDVATLSTRRVGVWGVLAGVVAGFVIIPFLGIPSAAMLAVGPGIIGAVGAMSAFATVRLAQHGASPSTADVLYESRLDPSTIARTTT